MVTTSVSITEFTTRNLAPEGDPINVPAPMWTDRDDAFTELHKATEAGQFRTGPCQPDSCLCAERTRARAARVEAVGTRDLWVETRQAQVRVDAPTMVPTAEGLGAAWSPNGLRLTFSAGGRVQSVRVDERGQQALRDALGVR